MKVLITPRSFAKYSNKPYETFEKNGFEIVKNPKNQIMTEEEMIDIIEDVDSIVVGVDPLSKNVLNNAKKLKVISKYGVGLDNIDLKKAEELNIVVERTLNANTEAVADYAFTLLCSVARRVVEIHNSSKAGDWSKKVSLDIYGKTLGIIGYGSIGKAVAKRASGFNMDVLVYDPFVKDDDINKVDLENLMRQSDFISIHSPLTDSTHHLINKNNIHLLKKNTIIVNTARGGIVEEEALYNALKDNKIYGAGIDVFEIEPATESKLLELDNVVIGNHTAASTIEAVDRMSEMATENVLKHFREE